MYQTPYGTIEVEQNVYQNSCGGKTLIPLASAARIIRSSTPRFAKQVTHKYARMNAGEVSADLKENHGRQISRNALQRLSDSVGAIPTVIAQLKEESWHYQTPKMDKPVKTVLCSLDGAYLLTVNNGWREAMVGTLSLYDAKGERQHTTYFGAAPEHGKAEFLKRYEQELAHSRSLYPDADYVGTADGAETNRAFLKRHTTRQILDYYHVSEYLTKASHAAYPQKTGKPKREQWLADRRHQLKHEQGAAQTIPDELKGFKPQT